MPFIESPQLETPNQRFAALEGIRALCALAIVVFHARTFTGPPWGTGGGEGDAGPWLAHLNVGVSVFFVLSGFLLFRPFVQAHLTDEGPPVLRGYLARRMIRIYPAYWLALILSTMILGLDLGNWWATVRIYTPTH
ncbi:MAG: acyltransferase, partial [Acidimicrobiales bacterium]|nr:acyltransferase [Acidimicrobiales bacterium]